VDIARRLHDDQRGSISLATVFALLLLTILLGMVINAGRQVDNKVKLQNAADAATYSGGVVLARGMNTLAFSNHLLCETFAMTAIMREARDRHADPLVPEILAAWNRIGPVYGGSNFPKFEALSPAIPQKTPLEQEMVRAYSDWMYASSELVLPVLEALLDRQYEPIPSFQRDVAAATPAMAQMAAARIAEAHTGRPGPSDAGRGPISGVLWRTIVDPVGGDGELARTTLPVVDPQVDWTIMDAARSSRDAMARHYLRRWNSVLMRRFDTEGKMSQFGALWRGFTCGQLEQLLAEHEFDNLPMVIREQPPGIGNGRNLWLDQDYMFVGVTYRRKMPAIMPRVFTDSLAADNQAFAQGTLFLPRGRIVWWRYGRDGLIHPVRQGVPRHWDLWNQNWSFQLVPSTSASIAAILGQPPRTPYVDPAAAGHQSLHVEHIAPRDLRRVTTH
jgi:hypothetical protein